MLYARIACEDDVRFLLPRLREADLAEIAAHCMTPEAALWGGYESSSPPWVGIHDGNPFCIFGVVPQPNQHGLVWMMATPEVGTIGRPLIRSMRPWVEHLNAQFPVLYNVIDERNTLHLRWLKWCGFELVERIPSYGPFGLPFWLFRKTYSCVSP